MRSSIRSTSIFSLCFFTLLVCSSAYPAEPKYDEVEAVSLARDFLQLVDCGQYGASWERAAPVFQRQVTREKWVKMLSGVRTPLGDVTSRGVKAAKFTTSLPGVPDGEYVVIQFATSFGKKAEAAETVTMERVQAEWQVAGYFIR